MSNPLLDAIVPYIPFDRIAAGDFLPALKHYRALAEKQLAATRDSNAEPDFENTIVSIETAAEGLTEVSSAFYVLFGAAADESIQQIAPDVSAFLADFGSDLFLDAGLFLRVQRVHETRQGVASPEDQRLLELTYRNFRRNGALLDDGAKERLREMDQELARLSPAFSENVLRATNAFRLHVEDGSSLAGLPASLLEQAEERARGAGKAGYMFTLQAPDYVPFMTYCEDRGLRETMYRGSRSRGLAPGMDNRPIIQRMLQLRRERAVLLGYANHPAYVLEERMASSPETVMQFLGGMVERVLPAAMRDLEELATFCGQTDLKPWDLRYYSEKLKKARYDFDQESMRSYFSLERVMQGIFQVAARLYGLRFSEKQGIPVYHSEVRVFEVSDEGGYMGLLYVDLFPRETKKNGAWMSAIREQGLFGGAIERPHVGITCNFTRPSSTRPSLLTPDEVRTLFHEFGHALHGLLSKATYRTLAGTNVYWDFVELPSQIMENWAKDKQALDMFAAHHETGQAIPEDLFQRMQAAETFQSGIQYLTQLNYGILDMALHLADPGDLDDLLAFERKATAKTTLISDPPELSMMASFSHIFSGGYSAGYYSYKWAEVLDADAFALFRDRGIFDPATAHSFRVNILEKGNTEHPMDLFIRFRGREPDAEALLRRDGLAG